MNEMEPMQDKPQDLSMKTARKLKPIPPPLDLNARTLDQEAPPKSPDELLPRESLPIRKRPLLDVRSRDFQVAKSPKSAGPHGFSHAFTAIDFRHVNTAPSSPLGFHMHPRLPVASTLTLTPSSASSLASIHSAFSHFPVPPPPLIPVPPPHSHMPKSPFFSAMAASISNGGGGGGNGFPTPPTDLHSPYQWPSPTSALGTGMFSSPFNPHSPLPFPTTALLSPAASSSYPSSTNSSREDLPLGGGIGSVAVDRESESRKRYLSAAVSKCLPAAADSSSPIPSSPLLSPRTWSHSWPTPAWQCFVQGTMIKFIIPDLETPWQKAEDLGWKDKISMKVDALNQYQYAPSGLVIVKIDVISRETLPSSSGSPGYSGVGNDRYGSAFTPVNSSGGGSSSGGSSNSRKVSGTTGGGGGDVLLRLRMAPHRGDNSTEILAECSLDHPFFVKEKGWCSAQPRLTIEKYGIPSQDISVGDVCLPPNHPDAVRTPDLCDRFRRFEFDDPTSPLNSVVRQQQRMTTTTTKSTEKVATTRKSVMSPPMSPMKKKEKDPDKPKRPMNGFMLFAKKFRLELIQQHPGKDNRAISVLLGEAWKSLALEDREQYSQSAKVMADEQKKLFPDCWKRKRSLTASGGNGQQQHLQQQQHQMLLPPPLTSPPPQSCNSSTTMRPVAHQTTLAAATSASTTLTSIVSGPPRHLPLLAVPSRSTVLSPTLPLLKLPTAVTTTTGATV